MSSPPPAHEEDASSSAMNMNMNMNMENDVPEENEYKDEYEHADYVSPPPYLSDQRVLCRDENNDKQFYASVVRRVKCLATKEWSFFVHYQGWNSRWDRWVSKDDLLLDSPDNRKAYLKAKEPKKRKPTPEPSSSRKKKSADHPAKAATYYQDYCELPFTLQTILVDEYDRITRKGFDAPRGYDCEPAPRPARSVHVLPAPVTVQQILQHYQRKRGGNNQQDKAKQQQVRKFCQGMALLFDDALPVCLLYPEERPQYECEYEALQRDDKPKVPSEVYGCEFLLRLMVRLPGLLQAEPKSEMDVMGPLIADLIVLMQKNRQACFKGTYREPKRCDFLDWEKSLADADPSTTEPKNNNNDSSTPTSQTMES
jgi:mortality factor 4-like protein 1